MNEIFKVAFYDTGEPLAAPPEDKDAEPLDDQADACDDAVYPCNDADENPVDDTDEQLKTARVVLVGEELFLYGCSFGHSKPNQTIGGPGNKNQPHSSYCHGRENRLHYFLIIR